MSAHWITLSCPSCGAQVSVSDDASRYRCEYCGNEHVLSPSALAAAQPIRPRVPVPAMVRIEKEGKSARIVQRWFSLKYIPMAFFSIAWDSFLCFWYGMALGNHAPWIFIVFPIAHLAVGIGLTYSTLCGFVNRTVLEVTPEELSVWFEPLPWLGEKTIPVRHLKQLYCVEKTQRSESGTSHQYKLMAVTQDGRQAELLSNLDAPDVALFFEQQIEDWLKIPDCPVAGELRR